MTRENIAIISVVGLPDPRTERIIYTLLKNNYKITFIGPYKDTAIINKEDISIISFKPNKYSISGTQPFYGIYRRRLIKILKEINPDIILAINITSAIFLKKIDYPLLIDLREILDLRYFYGTVYRKGRISKFRHVWLLSNIIDAEKELFESSSLITISRTSYEHYKIWLETKKIAVAKNYPLSTESKEPNLKKLNDEITFAYIGKEILKHKYGPHSYHRDMSLTWKVFRENIFSRKKTKLIVVGELCKKTSFLNCVGYVPHKEVYEYIAYSHFGLLTMKPSPIHFFANLLRAYMFTFMGVIPIITSSFKDVIDDIEEFAIIVDSSDFNNDLYLKLEKIFELTFSEILEKKKKLLGYARQNLIWEKNEKIIVDALKHV